MSWVDLGGTPYQLDADGERALSAKRRDLEDRVGRLRDVGRLTATTLEDYYGRTRFEQIAESNAIEGSTLSVGETELAVLKGVTLTGHDPKYAQDARHLDQALRFLADLARQQVPTTLAHAKAINGLVLNGDPATGEFRNYPVRITGSSHRPAETWGAISDQMEQWSAWSTGNPVLSSVIRAAVLHAWLVHIHPFGDGNGRTARAISNLEFIRAGLPPIIIKRTKHRDRYLEALRSADDGDLGPFLALVIDRAEDALRDLERAASGQGYDAALAKIRSSQEAVLQVWTAGVDFLYSSINAELTALAEYAGGALTIHRYRDALSLDEFIELCQERPISESWAFRLELKLPALPDVVRLAWVGVRSRKMQSATGASAAPSIFWSRPNQSRYPPWIKLDHAGPGGDELTLVGDTWHSLRDSVHRSFTTTELARAIAQDLVNA